MAKETRTEALNTLLTQKELLELVYTELSQDESSDKKYDKKTIREVYQAILVVMQKAVLDGRKVQLPQLCTITTRLRPARTCQNPHTKTPIKLEETVMPRFLTSKVLRTKLSQDKALLNSFIAANKLKEKEKKAKKEKAAKK